MRILIFNWRDLAHPSAGGAEVYVHEIAGEWVKSGHDVTIFCSAVAGRPSMDERDGVKIIRRGGRLSVYDQARRFYERDGVGRFDVVIDSVNTRPFLCPRFVRDAPVVALVYQVAREVCFYETPFPVALVGRYWLEPRWLRAYRDLPVLTISESSRVSLAAVGLRDISIVPVGLRLPDCLPTVQKSSQPTVLFVGRLTANKRPADAIKAFEIASARLPELNMWVVGDGPLRQHLQDRAPDRVCFTGRVADRRKFDLMARSHAIVATSVREGWGMTVSEAAAVGTPAIAYAVAGLRDSVGAAGGTLVDPHPRALAEELVRRLPQWVAGDAPDVAPRGTMPWSRVATSVLSHLNGAIARRESPSTAPKRLTRR